MFKLLLYLKIILIFVALNNGESLEKESLNGDSLIHQTPLPILWFPYPPNYQNDAKPEIATVAPVEIQNISTTSNTASAEKPNTDLSDNANNTDYLWFPYPSNYHSNEVGKERTNSTFECDNGKNIGVDFDPHDKRYNFNYLCIGNRTEYEPNMNTSALLKEYMVPAAYEPPVKCLNEYIEYTELIPFGSYRPLPPKYGTYQYLPPQRWLQSLADGAIVFLYHPCAFAGQIEQLQNTLRGCLYRHIITPSQLLTPQYPMALLAWGKSLQMSVMDDKTVVNFIKNNAKMGFKKKKEKLKTSTQLYDAGLLNEAHLVTDDQDNKICGYKEMR